MTELNQESILNSDKLVKEREEKINKDKIVELDS